MRGKHIYSVYPLFVLIASCLNINFIVLNPFAPKFPLLHSLFPIELKWVN